MAPPPRTLVDDLIGEILLRVPPHGGACLARASLVCKAWRSLLSDPAFPSNYRAFHRTPPLLGFLQVLKADEPYSSRFVSSASALGSAGRDFPEWLVLDCRHGRALFATSSPDDAGGAVDLVVWNPITNEQRCLPTLPKRASQEFNAAVLCATEGCDHDDCHGGPFRVVFITSTSDWKAATSARVYSSESGAWSKTTALHHRPFVSVDMLPSVLVGDALYFSCGRNVILECKLSNHGTSGEGSHQLSELVTPARFDGACVVIMKAEDGLLSVVDIEGSSISLWSLEVDTKGTQWWFQSRTVELQTLLPDDALPTPLTPRWIYVSGFVEGTDVIFVHSSAEVYMVQLESRRVTKMPIKPGRLYPFIGFPAIKAACKGPRDGDLSA